MGPKEELDLVYQARLGRREAFEALVRKHHVRIIGLCASLLGNASAAEDAAQEVFLKAYKSLDRFQGTSSFSTWLHRIAINHCMDILRKESRRKTESLDELVGSEGEGFHRLLSSSTDPLSSLEAADLAGRLLSPLPEEQRLALVLRETQGLSYQEIAQIMDSSVDSVKARLRRARETLQERLRHFLGAENV